MPSFIKLMSIVALVATASYVAARSGSAEPNTSEAPAATSAEPPQPRADDGLRKLQDKVSRLQTALEGLGSGSSDLSPLREQLRRLEVRLDELDRAPTSSEHAPSLALSDEEQYAVDRARTDILVASLDEHFDKEPRNEAWARQAESAIQSTLVAETGVSASHVSCQSKMCKVEMQHKDEQAEGTSLRKLVHVRELGDSEAFSERHQNADGTVSTVTYLTVGGNRLPEPPAL